MYTIRKHLELNEKDSKMVNYGKGMYIYIIADEYMYIYICMHVYMCVYAYDFVSYFAQSI